MAATPPARRPTRSAFRRPPRSTGSESDSRSANSSAAFAWRSTGSLASAFATVRARAAETSGRMRSSGSGLRLWMAERTARSSSPGNGRRPASIS